MRYKNKNSERKSDTSSLKEAIDAMLDSYKIRGKFDENKLINSWETMMGKPIARRTEKMFLKEKVLFVKLNSAPLRHELTIAKTKILEIIHRTFDASLVSDVKFY
jgi:predicted nucleic acid-binding Zn ribbon protein